MHLECLSKIILFHFHFSRKLLPNEPPKSDDFQEVPRYAEQIINLKNKVKSNKLKRKRKKKKVIKDDFIIGMKIMLIEYLSMSKY